MQVNEPNAEVTVDGQTITVQWGPDGKSAEITAPPGKHRIEIKKSGFRVSGKELTLDEGGHEILAVALESASKQEASRIAEDGSIKDPASPSSGATSHPPVSPVAASNAEPVDDARIDRYVQKGSIWVGRRTYSKDLYKGVAVSFFLNITARNGATFKGLKFDNGRYHNRAEVEGQINGAVITWREPGYGNVRGVLDADGKKLRVTSTGRFEGLLVLTENGTTNYSDRQAPPVGNQVNEPSEVRQSTDAERGASHETKRFVPLFNGKDLSGWSIDRDDKNGWRVEDGVIFARGVDFWTRNYLLTDREYSDYVLRLEFSLEKGAWTGVAVRAIPGENLPYKDGKRLFDHPIVKLIDNPEKNEQTGTMHWVLNRMYVAPDTPAVLQPAGSWNRMQIDMRGNRIQVWVNDKQIVNASLPQDAGFPDGTVPGMCRANGRIGLQRNIGTVRFRNIEVKELPLNSAPQESGARSSSYPAPPPVGEVGAPMKAGEVRDDNGLEMKFAYIPAGEFLMGSPMSDTGRNGNEKQHRVRITKPFYMAVFSVTQSEYERVMGKNPSWFSSTGNGKNDVAGMDTGRFPVEQVSWDEAMEFCRKFTESEQKAGRLPAGWKYTLPTEAQWEYACRAGTTTAYNVGETISMKDAKIDDAKFGRTAVVGSYKPNAWGLNDMHGNVWQWCADWYDDKYYDNSPADDPLGPTSGAIRVFRGGSWNDGPVLCRSAFRNGDEPAIRICHLGFRLVRVREESPILAPTTSGDVHPVQQVSGAPASTDALQPQSVWTRVNAGVNLALTILERQGEKFVGRFEVGPGIERLVNGTIKDGKISWLAKDVSAIKGARGGDNEGTIKGDSIDFTWHDDRGGSGKFTLKREMQPGAAASGPR